MTRRRFTHRRIVSSALGIAALVAVAIIPATGAAAAGRSGPSGQNGTQAPRPLPAHSQRPVCGPPAAGTAMCHAHVVTHAHNPTPLATGSYHYGYTPDELQDAYNLPAPANGQTVAIVDAFDNPNAEADLAKYRVEFNLGPCTTLNGCFKKVNQRGGTAYPKGDTGWGAEIDLDVEMVSAACPTCRIVLVEADSNSFSDLMAAVDQAVAQGATFVSNSYGGNEFPAETGDEYDGHFNRSNVAFTVSSGDEGYGAEYPAASQYVTAVGGTSLSEGGTRGWSETAWSGAGSGCSSYEHKPTWQTDSGCSHRTVADVSAVADPNTGVAVYDSYGSTNDENWYVYGGTSVAAPFIAGAWANAQAGTSESISRSPGTPYANAGGWFDVTSGSNTHHCRDGYLCEAVPGYDGPTGLGTPNGDAGFVGGTSGGGGGTTNQPPTASFTYTCTDLTCTFTDTSTDSDGTVTGWNWHFGTEAESLQQNPKHTFSGAGTYTVSLIAIDNDGASGSTSQKVTVGSSGSTSSITLTATGYKNRGRNTVDLSWTGAAATVDVYRDGGVITTVKGMSYTDNTGDRGSATYTYKVCDAGSTTSCSNTFTVVF
ncbi:MAG TPA: PKD domain-containing protein [Nocardioidaceae bacterium]|nr:PKD domain-containing protein [Nocardioidaceae bacterium]